MDPSERERFAEAERDVDERLRERMRAYDTRWPPQATEPTRTEPSAGEWYVSNKFQDGRNHNVDVLCDGFRIGVAFMGWSSRKDVRLEEAEANALRFAASKDLLAACEQALADRERALAPDVELVARLRAAIAKATGAQIATPCGPDADATAQPAGPSAPITLDLDDAEFLLAILQSLAQPGSSPRPSRSELALLSKVQTAVDRCRPAELTARERSTAAGVIRHDLARDDRRVLLCQLDPSEARQPARYTPSTEAIHRSTTAAALAHVGATAQQAAGAFEVENCRLRAEIARLYAQNGQPSIWLSPPVSPEAVTWAAVSPEVREVVDSALASYVVLTTGLPSERFVGPAVSAARALLKSVPFNGPAAEPAKEEP